jgi:hypothetical protein
MYESLLLSMKNHDFYYQEGSVGYIYTPILVDSIFKKLRCEVKSFKNKQDFYSLDEEKIFRAKTVYGIGYINTLPIGDQHKLKYPKNEFRVCIGIDKHGNPIIRKLIAKIAD